MPHRPVSLRQLRTGQSGRIVSIRGDADRVHRLEEFGLRGGARVEMFRSGNPCILRLSGNKVCFRAEDSLDILVLPLPATD